MLSNSWTQPNPIQVYVERACDPSLHEPNYALNLELVDYISRKKANTPRDAAMAVVNLINHRNPHVSMLALNLLQILVQNCGYPFHLQISTKEFLNELVRRFPERPPPFPGPIMTRILELIHEWKETLCKDSRWKDDLGNIRDMHRLLSFKGYRFRDNARSNASQSLSATANLKSPDELENEDREAQAAKLQELIRRGTPRDLAAAQDLMKLMSGAEPERKPDYRSQTLHELEKLQSKVILLNDLLDNVDTSKGEKFANGDAYDQVATVCRQARPKIQKWISDAEESDPESLDTLLSVNDLINNVLERYDRYQHGDYTNPEPPVPEKKSDLIDFDLEDSSGAPAAANTSSASAIDDLESLFGSAPQATTSAPIQLGGARPSVPLQTANLAALYQQQQQPQQPVLGNAQGMNLFGGGGGNANMNRTASPMLPFGGQGSLGSVSLGASGHSTPMGTIGNSAGSLWGANAGAMGGQNQATTAGQGQVVVNTKDPFADLAGLF